jgi:hypothetical protein
LIASEKEVSKKGGTGSFCGVVWLLKRGYTVGSVVCIIEEKEGG